MKAAIYNPYLDTLGGGERYTVAVARVLVKKGYKVDVEWKDSSIKEKLEKRFGEDLSGVSIVGDIKRGDGYDLSFWLSDGSIPLLRARHNLLHFQFPFRNINGKTLLNKMKFFRIEKVICNSHFTKGFIDKEYGINSIVIYPPVDISRFRAKRKENLILSVGRFSQLTQAKRQDVLVSAFKKLYDQGAKDWKLVLAGGSEVGVDDFVEKLREASVGYTISLVENPSLKDLVDLYGRSKIFWSASGHGIEEEKEPLRVEHFGIAVVEAMAAGCVPAVVEKGGYKEIIKRNENGFFWDSTSELLMVTRKLIEYKKLLKKISDSARKSSFKYSYDNFEKAFGELL